MPGTMKVLVGRAGAVSRRPSSGQPGGKMRSHAFLLVDLSADADLREDPGERVVILHGIREVLARSDYCADYFFRFR